MAEPSTTSARIKTGVPGLDELLGGGLLPGRTVLVKGAPGSGKTTLGLQMLVAGAMQFGEPGVLLTFEQLPEQLAADAAGFGWDLQALKQQNLLHVMLIRPEDVLEQPGRQENRLLAQIGDLIEDFQARRILIDSLSHLETFSQDEKARSLLMKFLVQLKALGLTPLMTAELKSDEGLAGLDAYLVDTLINLFHHSGGVGQPSRRQLEIIKTRGHAHVTGVHPFEIGPRGVVVYPHGSEVTAAASEVIPHATTALPTGVEGLDALLNGGYSRGSVILAAGLSGTFKTTLAAHFATAGGADAPATLWLSFQETADMLEAAFAPRGIDLAGPRRDGRLTILDASPRRDPVEKILLTAETLIRERKIGRVVIDSADDLTASARSDDQAEALGWFLRRLRALGVTTFLTQRLSKVTGLNPLSEIAGAELADTIVYLGLVEIESRLEKVISVLKHRGGPVEGDLRSIGCTARGLRVSERFIGLSGVLAGSAQGRRKQQIEEIFQPLYFVRDFLALAKDESLDPARRAAMLDNLSTETARLIGVLGRFFDQPAGGAAEGGGTTERGPKP